MRQVYVVGVGMAPFGKYAEKSVLDLGKEACKEAFEDCNASPKDVEVAFCGAAGLLDDQLASTPGQKILRQVGITKIPIFNLESACASSSVALHNAWNFVASGVCDVALVAGIEKMTGKSREERLASMSKGSDIEIERGLTFPGVFGIAARRHMHEFGTKREQIALVSVKNHKHAVYNPKAMYRKELTVEEVLSSPLIADPLTLYECSPMCDGAAAAIIASEDIAKKLSDTPIKIEASVYVTGEYSPDPRNSFVMFEPTVRARNIAYRKAGIENPIRDIDLAEVHDCFAIAEIIHYEDLGFCRKGEGGKLVEEGVTWLGGNLPVSVSGGLLSKGHPLGATGVAQIVEIVEQLRGEAGKRQVDNAEVGLAHCLGGFMSGDACSATIHILSRKS